ncbi:MAG: hypothetical protein ACXVB4_17480 [Pseudobdellovibrionaceae bacterium]
MKKNAFTSNILVLSTMIGSVAFADLSNVPNFVTAKHSRLQSLDDGLATKVESSKIELKAKRGNFEDNVQNLPNKVFNESQGGVNGGGGNSINGRIIEYYVVDIKKVSGYKEIIVPILRNMSLALPQFEALLKTTLSRMTWYIVPASLRPRSNELTGLPFPSDQVAVQGNLEVFIDESMFKKLLKSGGKPEQGRLLLHEIIMASTQVSCSLRNEADPFACMWGIDQSEMHLVTRKTVNFLMRNPNADQNTLIEGLKAAGWNFNGKMP